MGIFISSKTKVSKTGKEARMRARIDAIKKGQIFDESQTPKEELENLDKDMMDAIINDNIESLFRE